MSKIRYINRVCAKLFCFAFFGFSSLILAFLLFPIMHCLSGFSEQKFKKIARKFNHLYFKIFVKISIILGAVHLSVQNKEALEKIHSKVVIANHPSLFDVVILFSLIPNADCIVKGELIQNRFISIIIKNLYIPNNIPFDEQLERARISMDEGNNLIIFPKGHVLNPVSRGSSRKALHGLLFIQKKMLFQFFLAVTKKLGSENTINYCNFTQQNDIYTN